MSIHCGHETRWSSSLSFISLSFLWSVSSGKRLTRTLEELLLEDAVNLSEAMKIWVREVVCSGRWGVLLRPLLQDKDAHSQLPGALPQVDSLLSSVQGLCSAGGNHLAPGNTLSLVVIWLPSNDWSIEGYKGLAFLGHLNLGHLMKVRPDSQHQCDCWGLCYNLITIQISLCFLQSLTGLVLDSNSQQPPECKYLSQLCFWGTWPAKPWDSWSEHF